MIFKRSSNIKDICQEEVFDKESKIYLKDHKGLYDFDYLIVNDDILFGSTRSYGIVRRRRLRLFKCFTLN